MVYSTPFFGGKFSEWYDVEKATDLSEKVNSHAIGCEMFK